MNKILPKEIEFLFRNKNGKTYPYLIVFFILTTSKKNNYYIRLKTNKEGRINLEKSLIISLISLYMKEFPMDYSSTLEECTFMEVRVETKEELEKRVVVMENYYPKEALLFRNEIINCTNNKISFLCRYTLPIREEKFIIEIG